MKIQAYLLVALFSVILRLSGTHALKCNTCSGNGTDCSGVSAQCLSDEQNRCFKIVSYIAGRKQVKAGCETSAMCLTSQLFCSGFGTCVVQCCSTDNCNAGQQHSQSLPTERPAINTKLPGRPGLNPTQSLKCFNCSGDGTSCRRGSCSSLEQCATLVVTNRNGKSSVRAGCTTFENCAQKEKFCTLVKSSEPAVDTCEISCCSTSYCNYGRNANVPKKPVPTKPAPLQCFFCTPEDKECKDKETCPPDGDRCGKVIATENGKTVVQAGCTTSQNCSGLKNLCLTAKVEESVTRCDVVCCDSSFCNASSSRYQVFVGVLTLSAATVFMLVC